MTNKTIGMIVATCVLSAGPADAQNAIPAPKQDHPIALVGGTIHPVSSPAIAGGTIVFNNGSITAVGASVEIPANAERIDVSGKHIYPGFVDAYNTTGLVEISGGAAGTVDLTETGDLNPSVRAEVAFQPESEHIPVMRSRGVTVVNVSPNGGLISGMTAAMMLEGWTWEDMTLHPSTGMIVNWPSMTYVPSPFRRQTKEQWTKQRDGALTSLKELFDNARAYMVSKESGRSDLETDPGLEAMIPVLKGTVPVIVNAGTVGEIQAAMQFTADQHVRMILAGGEDAWRVAPLLKERDIPVIMRNIERAGRRWESYDIVYGMPARFEAAGIRYCISGGDDMFGGWISHAAGHAAAFGLDRDAALRAVTLAPAQILGLADKVGSLETGKDADLFIADGDALEISTRIEQVYIQGRSVDMRDKHRRLYEKYKEKYRQMDARR